MARTLPPELFLDFLQMSIPSGMSFTQRKNHKYYELMQILVLPMLRNILNNATDVLRNGPVSIFRIRIAKVCVYRLQLYGNITKGDVY